MTIQPNPTAGRKVWPTVGRVTLRVFTTVAVVIIVLFAVLGEVTVWSWRATWRATRAAMRLGWDFFWLFVPILGWAILLHRGATYSRRRGQDRLYDKPLWPHWRLIPAWAK